VAFDRYRHAREVADVDLIPVMNLFVVMIPFLLLSAAFLHVGVIPTSLPSRGAGTSDVATELNKITLNLQINPDGIVLSASNPELDPELLESLATTVPRVNGELDLPTLNTVLAGLKTSYPASDTVILLPATGTPYVDVVRVLDASRERTVDAGEPTERHEPLFPVVVLSKKVEA